MFTQSFRKTKNQLKSTLDIASRATQLNGTDEPTDGQTTQLKLRIADLDDAVKLPFLSLATELSDSEELI